MNRWIFPLLVWATLPLSAADTPWWSLFQDRALDGLERQALVSNGDLRQALARIVEARAQTRVAASAFFPHLEAPINATRTRSTDTGPIVRSRIVGGFPLALPVTGAAGATPALPDSFAGQQATTTFNDFQAELAISYELDVFGRLRHNFAQARANAEASTADREAIQLSLTAQVASQYFALRALDAQSEVLQRTFHLRAEAVQIQHARVKAGVTSELDLARAELEQANTEADLNDAWRERGELQNNLAVLCGQSAGPFRLPAQPLGTQPPPAVPVSIPAEVMQQRPDLVEAERRLRAAGEGVRVARSELLPTFKIEGNYGYESAEFGKLIEDRSHVWTITGGIQVPIFEGGRNAANLKAAKARADQAKAAYEQSALSALREVENALLDLRQRASQAEIRERALLQANRVFDSSQKRYEEGAVNYFEVIDAERVQLSAELLRVQTLQARYQATVDLIRAAGGRFTR